MSVEFSGLIARDVGDNSSANTPTTWTTAVPDWVGYTTAAVATAANSTGLVESTSFPGDDGLFDKPLFVKIIWGVMYAVITVLAIGGNVLVCVIVLTNHRMRNVTNYFLVSQGVSDILMAVFCIIPTYYSTQQNEWVFGAVLCPVVLYTMSLTVTVSVFTMIALALDRYVAVLHPLKPRMSHRASKLSIGAIWVAAACIGLPVALFSRKTVKFGGEGSDCYEVWPHKKSEYHYSVAVMCIQYFVPLVILCVAYGRICCKLLGREVPGERDNARDAKQAASTKKLIKMLISVVITFAICWLPLYTFTIIHTAHDKILYYPHIDIIYFACHWISMTSAMWNPIIYFSLNRNFRRGLKKLWHCSTLNSYPEFTSQRNSSILMREIRKSEMRYSRQRPFHELTYS